MKVAVKNKHKFKVGDRVTFSGSPYSFEGEDGIIKRVEGSLYKVTRINNPYYQWSASKYELILSKSQLVKQIIKDL